jgi:hypothetical protein
MAVRTHLDQIKLTEPPGPVEGCEKCLATGVWWVHLRMCQTCGKVGRRGRTRRERASRSGAGKTPA